MHDIIYNYNFLINIKLSIFNTVRLLNYISIHIKKNHRNYLKLLRNL